MRSLIFAVDIGGSKMVCGVLNRKGEILRQWRTEYSPGYSAEDLFQYVREGFRVLNAGEDCSVCGATVPGLCDVHTGRWLYAPFSGLSDIPITDILTEITGFPAYADNDVNLCALAERYFGACRNIRDFLWITVSNGIGGGLFLNGELYRGSRLTAGEMGHLTVEENGRLCGCGKRGCLEAMASGAYLSAIYEERNGIRLPTKKLAELAREGDEEALALFRTAGTYIGKGISHAVNLLGLDTVVLGGGVAESFSLLEPGISDALAHCVFDQGNPEVHVIHSPLGQYAALKGCAALVLDEEMRRQSI
ncbi:MAG: ROK family protein [Clostridia bacterium]|nr:ROK family protein [Clostridia bacterium]